MANVVLKNVYKYYEKNPNPSVSDFNMEIADKEFIVFVGPSGCGKSTTLRMIAGLEIISEGEVYIDDRLVNDVEPKDRDIAMVFQNYALYPHMTVFNNMAFGLKMAKVPRELRDKNTIIRGKDGKPLNIFARLFGKTLQELKDENGNIVCDENGNAKYEVRKNKDGSDLLDKNGAPVYAKRPYTDDEKWGKIVLDGDGKPVLMTKKYLFTRKAKDGTVIAKKGDVKMVKGGNPVKVELKKADGSPKLDKNGNPVCVMRRLKCQVAYKLRKYSKAEIREKVYEAARILDIEQYMERKPSQLSGGQRQRVAIGRAIVRKPKVFLMDEPLSNLDAKLRNQMRAEIKLIAKKVSTTFIYVTHDQVEAMTLGDRIVIMKDGVIQQIGTPAEVFNHPQNLFVAGFIGAPQMNFFDARLVKEEDCYKAELNGARFHVTKRVNKSLSKINAEDTDIKLGVRPEHVKIKTQEYHDDQVEYIKGTVKVCEMMGSELYIHATFGEDLQQKIVIRVPTISLTEEEYDNIVNLGEIEFTFAKEATHIFDLETEQNYCPLD